MPGSTDALPNLETVTLERDGHVLLIGLNRPDKRNAFNQAMLTDLSRAYGLLESDASVRAGVLYASTSPAVLTWSMSVPTSRPAISRCPPTDETRGAWTVRGPRRLSPRRTVGA
jgi:enoyl-CoA hydratase